MKYQTMFCSILAVVIGVCSSAAFAGYGVFVTKDKNGVVSNESKVAVVRDGNRTVITVSNFVKTAASEIALIVPVPKVIEPKQINVGSLELLRRLDVFTAPRLVHRKDPNPCEKGLHKRDIQGLKVEKNKPSRVLPAVEGVASGFGDSSGGYEVLPLSANESKKVGTWLRKNGYKPSRKALNALSSYVRMGWKFVVAKIKLSGTSSKFALKPLQIAYVDKNLSLPLRVGSANSKGFEDVTFYLLSRKGRVLPKNFKTLKLPTSLEIPEYVKKDFSGFYKATFAEANRRAKGAVFFLEHAWNSAWCDPCVEKPLSAEELREIGVFWAKDKRKIKRNPAGKKSASDVFISRLHMRVNSGKLRTDPVLETSRDRNTYQGNYYIMYPFGGEMNCGDLKQYEENFASRRQNWAKNLAGLTGWEISTVRRKMKLKTPPDPDGTDWIDDLWK